MGRPLPPATVVTTQAHFTEIGSSFSSFRAGVNRQLGLTFFFPQSSAKCWASPLSFNGPSALLERDLPGRSNGANAGTPSSRYTPV
jgi:hypothetical protein